MSLAPRDRGDMNVLHVASNGTGSSLDGSRKRSREVSDSSTTRWNKPATPIAMPHNADRSGRTRSTNAYARGGTNPWSGGTFDNLRGSAQKPALRDASGSCGNPSSRTVVPRGQPYQHHPNSSLARPDRAPEAKKARVDRTAVANGSDASYSIENSTTVPQQTDSNRLGPSIAAQASQELDNIFANSPQLEKPGRSTKRSKKPFHDQSPVSPTSSKRFDVIDIDQEEDLGESIEPSESAMNPRSDSSDEMQLIPRGTARDGSRPVNPSSTVQQILGVPDPSTSHPFAKGGKYDFEPLPPGPLTAALKVEVDRRASCEAPKGDEVSNDSIQDPDGFDNEPRQTQFTFLTSSKRKSTPSGTTSFQDGRVRHTVQLYDSLADRPPEVDLIVKHAQKPSLTRGMKPKWQKGKLGDFIPGAKPAKEPELSKPPPGAGRRRNQQDDIATSSSGFQSKGKGRESEEASMLPIEIWALGTRVIESLTSEDPQPQYWLRVQDKYVSVLSAPIAKGNKIFEFEVGHDINALDLPKNGGVAKVFPLLVFNLRVTDRTRPFIEETDGLELGSKSMIAVKLLTSHPNWTLPNYQRIVSLLTKEELAGVCYLDINGIRSRWEMLRREGDAIVDSVEAYTEDRTTRRKPKPRPAFAGALGPSSAIDQASSSSSRAPQGIRRTTRHSAASRQFVRPPSPPPDETILLYPPTGTGAVNVTNADLKRLEPGEYLNDTLIEFGLKLWLNDLRAARPEFAEQVHVFSPFFYTQLNKKKSIEEGYRSVRKWTQKFDLFKKKYIVVPINEHLHWYLAIICHPERTLQRPAPTEAVAPNVTTRTKFRESLPGVSLQKRPTSGERSTSSRPPSSKHSTTSANSDLMDEQGVEDDVSTFHYASGQEAAQEANSPSPSTSTLSPEPDAIQGEFIPQTESEGEDDSRPVDVPMAVDSPPPHSPLVKSREVAAVPPSAFYAVPEPTDTNVRNNSPENGGDQEEDQVDELDSDDAMEVDVSTQVVEPQIFSFDSLGSRHPHALKVLSRYLTMEAKDKKGLSETVQAVTKQASVPAQPNYCDCGVYLLHFVEEFMSDPDGFTRHITDYVKSKKATESNKLNRERLWKHDAVANRREDMKQRLISLSSEWRREKEAEGTAKGKGKAEVERSKTPAQSMAMDEDSDIEVLEMSPEPSRPVNRTRLAVPVHKAERFRGR